MSNAIIEHFGLFKKARRLMMVIMQISNGHVLHAHVRVNGPYLVCVVNDFGGEQLIQFVDVSSFVGPIVLLGQANEFVFGSGSQLRVVCWRHFATSMSKLNQFKNSLKIKLGQSSFVPGVSSIVFPCSGKGERRRTPVGLELPHRHLDKGANDLSIIGLSL